MCGRFTLKTPAATIGSLFPEFDLLDLEPRFNIAPTQDVACVRVGESGASELAWLRWGLVPFWACLLYTSPSPRDRTRSRMPSSA